MDAPSTVESLREAWPRLQDPERLEAFQALSPADALVLFPTLSAYAQGMLALACPPTERRLWLRLLPPDDLADVLQEVEPEEHVELLQALDAPTRAEVRALLAYGEDEAGGLMSPRYVRVRPELRVPEAMAYLRRQAHERVETVYYGYVLDQGQHLLGVVTVADLFAAPVERTVREVMRTEVVSVPEDMDQEHVARVIAESDLLAVPVVDAEGRMKGIVTVDDIVDVVQSEATEDIQKMGGTAALDRPYLQTSLLGMLRSRAGWLAVLFLSEMLTASAMAHYQGEIARAVVLTIFIPLIISSGGNAGSQASTLLIRAMALGEVRLRDWWRVVRREMATGLYLGVILACIGLLRILVWEAAFHSYGEHAGLVALTVAGSLVGVVAWGTLAGSMLPFLLRRLGFDPASASAPFVATLVDVFGLVIYFSVAEIVLRGTLL
jgi:magnesium transporter